MFLAPQLLKQLLTSQVLGSPAASGTSSCPGSVLHARGPSRRLGVPLPRSPALQALPRACAGFQQRACVLTPLTPHTNEVVFFLPDAKHRQPVIQGVEHSSENPTYSHRGHGQGPE